MKTKLAVLSAAATILLTSFSSTIPTETTYAESASATNLTAGTTSAGVSALQQNLKTLGYFTYPTLTGYYGPITTQAVKDYQTAYGLAVTGTADASTQTSIAHALVKKQLMADAMTYLRVPYTWGGISPSTGFDCSGFVYYMFSTHGVSMSRTSSSVLYTMGSAIERSALRPGDLVFFSTDTPGVVSHVGFYMGNNQFLSATRSAGIYPQSLDSSYWGPRYIGARRVY